MNLIGVDLGATNIAVGIVDESGRILVSGSEKTLADHDYMDIVHRIALCIGHVLEAGSLSISDIHAIGIGIPGIVDEKNGIVTQCTNLSWYNLPIQKTLQTYFPVPIRIGNDANLAALAESVAGASVGYNSSVLLTLGTGVGGAIIINGQPWNGAFGMAGEIGHTTLVADGIPCRCGRNGCMEQYCSATALIRSATQACWSHPETVMLRLADGNPADLTARMVIDAAKAGDYYALQVFTQYVHYLALAIDSLINMINPEIILLGGGISHAGDYLLDAVCAQIPSHEKGSPRPLPRIALASLGNDAGIIGAAMLGRSI